MSVPYTFGTATSPIPLSQLDSNFSTPITLGNTNVYLGNTASTIDGLSLSNVTITSGETVSGSGNSSATYTATFKDVNGYLNFYVRDDGAIGAPKLNNFPSAQTPNVYFDGTNFYKSNATVQTAGPAFGAYQSVAQSISAATFTKLQFDTKEYDTNTNYSISTYQFTPTVAGYYQINAAYYMSIASNTSLKGIALYKNGVGYKYNFSDAGPSGYDGVSVSSLVYCNGTTDYIEMYAYNSIGGTTQNSITYTWFNGVFIRS